MPIFRNTFRYILMKKLFYIFLILCCFISCRKNKNLEKEVLLSASDKRSFIDTTKLSFKLFSDSTYIFNVNVKGELYDKVENYKGSVTIEKDSLYFFPSRFGYNNAEKANLKNGYIEFLDDKEPLRMKIDKTKLYVKETLDYKKFKNYAFFNYEKYGDEDDENKNYDVTEKDIYEIESLLKPEFRAKKLDNYENYLKQVIGYKNTKGEVFAKVKCFCNSQDKLERFQKNIINMSDGGKCNLYIVINLTKKKIEFFITGGMG